MSHHDTLNISLQTDNRRYDSRISKTIDLDNRSESEAEGGENEERVRRFRQLYYRNEKLRKQLKNLNIKLNQRLEKVKFPSVKKRAASVDLNHVPPSKALTRELQNASKQVKMYKKQVEILKIKQQSSETYEKLKNMENAIAYKDIEISDVQKELVSIKSVKKMQQKKITADLQNEEVKQRLQQYQKQHKELKDRLKQISRESRKKQQNYKKQQAYSISLEKKVREVEKKEEEQEKMKDRIEVAEERPYRQISQVEFKNLKKELENQKKQNDEVLKKIQISKKIIKREKEEEKKLQQKYKEKDAQSKLFASKIESLHRLIREQERREKTPPKNKLITKIEEMSFNDEDDDNSEENKYAPTISKDDNDLRKMLNDMSEIDKQERNWKGKYRKVQNGFGGPTDHKFQFQGQLVGFKVSQDENQSICGLICIFRNQFGTKQEIVQGTRSNIELQWVAEKDDSIAKIYGSFTEQSYLNELVVVSRTGKSGVFGSRAQDSFTLTVEQNEMVSGCFGSVRQLGQDTRITELGFWIERTA